MVGRGFVEEFYPINVVVISAISTRTLLVGIVVARSYACARVVCRSNAALIGSLMAATAGRIGASAADLATVERSRLATLNRVLEGRVDLSLVGDQRLDEAVDSVRVVRNRERYATNQSRKDLVAILVDRHQTNTARSNGLWSVAVTQLLGVQTSIHTTVGKIVRQVLVCLGDGKVPVRCRGFGRGAGGARSVLHKLLLEPSRQCAVIRRERRRRRFVGGLGSGGGEVGARGERVEYATRHAIALERDRRQDPVACRLEMDRDQEQLELLRAQALDRSLHRRPCRHGRKAIVTKQTSCKEAREAFGVWVATSQKEHVQIHDLVVQPVAGQQGRDARDRHRRIGRTAAARLDQGGRRTAAEYH